MGLYFRNFKRDSPFRQIFLAAARPVDKKKSREDDAPQKDEAAKCVQCTAESIVYFKKSKLWSRENKNKEEIGKNQGYPSSTVFPFSEAPPLLCQARPTKNREAFLNWLLDSFWPNIKRHETQ